jgi:hypothetical protein
VAGGAQGQGQYWADLARISNAAIRYYTAKATFKHDGTDMLVFDIDETCARPPAQLLSATACCPREQLFGTCCDGILRCVPTYAGEI